MKKEQLRRRPPDEASDTKSFPLGLSAAGCRPFPLRQTWSRGTHHRAAPRLTRDTEHEQRATTGSILPRILPVPPCWGSLTFGMKNPVFLLGGNFWGDIRQHNRSTSLCCSLLSFILLPQWPLLCSLFLSDWFPSFPQVRLSAFLVCVSPYSLYRPQDLLHPFHNPLSCFWPTYTLAHAYTHI